MDWFRGPISQAVQKVRQENRLFVVYIQGINGDTGKMDEVWEKENVMSACRDVGCIAIQIQAESEEGKYFDQIYSFLSVPSTYFIGPDGKPVKITEGFLAEEDFIQNIQNAQQRFQDVSENMSGELSGHQHLKSSAFTGDELVTEERGCQEASEITESKNNLGPTIEKMANEGMDEANQQDLAAVQNKHQAEQRTTLKDQTTYEEARLQIRLPDGFTISKTFDALDTLNAVHVFIASKTGGEMSISTMYPKRYFTEEDRPKTLISLGLVPTAVLIAIDETKLRQEVQTKQRQEEKLEQRQSEEARRRKEQVEKIMQEKKKQRQVREKIKQQIARDRKENADQQERENLLDLTRPTKLQDRKSDKLQAHPRDERKKMTRSTLNEVDANVDQEIQCKNLGQEIDENEEIQCKNLGQEIDENDKEETQKERHKRQTAAKGKENSINEEGNKLMGKRMKEQMLEDRQERANRYKEEKQNQERRLEEKRQAFLRAQEKAAAEDYMKLSEKARLQIRLPDGSSISNTFDSTDTLEVVHQFITSHTGTEMCISTAMPRRIFTEDDRDIPLISLQLVPRAVLIAIDRKSFSSDIQKENASNTSGFLLTTVALFLLVVLAGVFLSWGDQ